MNGGNAVASWSMDGWHRGEQMVEKDAVGSRLRVDRIALVARIVALLVTLVLVWWAVAWAKMIPSNYTGVTWVRYTYVDRQHETIYLRYMVPFVWMSAHFVTTFVAATCISVALIVLHLKWARSAWPSLVSSVTGLVLLGIFVLAGMQLLVDSVLVHQTASVRAQEEPVRGEGAGGAFEEELRMAPSVDGPGELNGP